jgi:hypothetical protein
MAHEDLPPAGRIGGGGRIEGAEDLKLAYMRIELKSRQTACFNRAPEKVLIQVATRR